MRLIIAFVMLVMSLLVGCTATPVNLSAQLDDTSGGAFGLFADANNPAEMKATPVVVRLAADLTRAQRLLHRKRLTATEVVFVRDCADKIKATISDAVKRFDLHAIDAAAAQVGECETIFEVHP